MLAEQKAGGYSTKYRLTGKEVDEETGLYYFGARYYDPKISLWYGVDPMASKYPTHNPFNYTLNNPINFIDPDGNSVHTDDEGCVIATFDDKDNGVYVHKAGTSLADINKQRQGGKFTGGDGNFIGELGGDIDVSTIYQNMLDKDGNQAKNGLDQSNPAQLSQWMDLVKKGGEWDLKNNKSTIFGVAWDFDKSSGKDHTNFLFGDLSGNAADFGNHHAGYTATMLGIPETMQFIGAGVVEQLKQKNYYNFNPNSSYPGTGPSIFLSPPYGDRQRDYDYNKMGMKDALLKKR